MGGCTHPVMTACYMKRHNGTVAEVAQAVSTGSKGRWLLVADLRADALDELGREQKKEVASRIPGYMLPGVSEEDRVRMRPDILFVDGLDEGWQDERVTEEWLGTAKKKCKVYILEVGYCRDSAARRKREEKKRQHTRLKKRKRKKKVRKREKDKEKKKGRERKTKKKEKKREKDKEKRKKERERQRKKKERERKTKKKERKREKDEEKRK